MIFYKITNIFMDLNNTIRAFVETYTHSGVIIWLTIELFIIALIIFVLKVFPKSKFVIFFDLVYEKIYEFFEDLLWKEERISVIKYVTILFFVVLFSNLLWVFIEFIIPIFWYSKEWKPLLEHFISSPTTNINFNLAMAIIWTLIILYEQFRFLWLRHFIYEYFPILWKNYIPYTIWGLPKIVDIPLFLLVKSFDIIISIFLWALEIIWLLAKIISLSFRLFWNMTSGWTLIFMLFGALSTLTISMVWFDIPVLFPLIVYLQELLVALIQALVFPLLIAIFIKVVKIH